MVTQWLIPRTYRQVRRQNCLALLRAFVRRWGAYLAIAACIAGIGAPAVAVWSVLPLFWSLGHSLWVAPALLSYAAFGALLLWAARTLLWPRAWAEVEQALPVPRAQRIASDTEVVMLALLPLAALFGTGAAVLLAEDPAWLRPNRLPAVAALLFALAGAVVLAVVGLQHLRRAAVAAGTPRGDAVTGPPARPHALRRRHWWWALGWVPLSRGPARRTARAMLMGGTVLLAIAAAAVAWSGQARWGMAAFAALALVVVSRVNALSRLELAPLLVQSAHLPVMPATLERARAALALAPALVGLVGLGIATTAVATRPLVWWAFVAASCLSWWVEVRMRPHDDAAKGARWLLSLALGVALGTEAVA